MSPARGFVVNEDDCAIERPRDPRRLSVQWRTLVSGDRTPTDSLTVGVAELSPGSSADLRVHLHRHAQPEVYYVLSGQGVVTISGTAHPVRRGSAVFIPGQAEHCAQNTGTEPLRLLYVFAADSFEQIRYEFSGS